MKTKPKTTTFQIRLTDADKAAFEEAAELDGRALSSWARARLRKVAASELTAAGRPVAFLEKPKKP